MDNEVKYAGLWDLGACSWMKSKLASAYLSLVIFRLPLILFKLKSIDHIRW